MKITTGRLTIFVIIVFSILLKYIWVDMGYGADTIPIIFVGCLGLAVVGTVIAILYLMFIKDLIANWNKEIFTITNPFNNVNMTKEEREEFEAFKRERRL